MVAEPRRKHRVIDERIVLNVDRRNLVVILQVEPTGATWLPSPENHRTTSSLVVDSVVEFDDAVVAVAVLWVRAVEMLGAAAPARQRQATGSSTWLQKLNFVAHGIVHDASAACCSQRGLGGQTLNAIVKFCFSNAPKKNVLFLTIGCPAKPPHCTFLISGLCVSTGRKTGAAANASLRCIVGRTVDGVAAGLDHQIH